jgi:HSP20 family molecular chaperone IbpA
VLTLPASVDRNKVDAKYRNDVLTVTLPKIPEAKPKRIPVKPS